MHKSEWQREGYGRYRSCNIKTVADWLLLSKNTTTIYTNSEVFTGGP